jgi:hypothetical protein
MALLRFVAGASYHITPDSIQLQINLLLLQSLCIPWHTYSLSYFLNPVSTGSCIIQFTPTHRARSALFISLHRHLPVVVTVSLIEVSRRGLLKDVDVPLLHLDSVAAKLRG